MTVDFLFVETETPLIIALVIAGGLGALIGWALPHVRRSRRVEREREAPGLSPHRAVAPPASAGLGLAS